MKLESWHCRSDALRKDPACRKLVNRYIEDDDVFDRRLTHIQLMLAYDRAEGERIRQSAMRERMRRLLAAATSDNGKVGVDVWSMDCDGVSGSHLRWIDPSVRAWEALHEECGKWAEGPYRLTIVPPADLYSYQPQRQRDHALEAFEDGHQHVLFV